MKNKTEISNTVEAALFSAEEPLSTKDLRGMFKPEDAPATDELNAILDQLASDYHGRGIELVSVANGYRFQTQVQYASALRRLRESRPPRYSRALLETLAIIAYRQPVTRGDVEEIRGVAFGTNTLEILLELDWVRPAGRKDVLGKPILYATTENFLNHFNIQKLSDLPTIDELGTAGLIDTSSIDKSIFGTGKFFKEQSIIENQNDIYEDIEEAIKKAPEEEK